MAEDFKVTSGLYGSIPVTTGPIGWICPDCGAWVSPDAAHVCRKTARSIEPHFIYERIAAALERIAAALESDG